MKRDTSSRRGFSLIELMIVILIIAVVVAILLPALGSVRSSTRKASTNNLLQNVSQAISQFTMSERRQPGYFTAKEMGGTDNVNEGFSSMNNILLDLAGGVVPQSTPDAVEVGPGSNAAGRVWFHEDAVGNTKFGSKGYFTPPQKYYKLANGTEGIGTKVASAANLNNVRELVDAEDMPIMAWMPNVMATGPITQPTDFATGASGGNSPARFYQNANAAHLNATALGKKLVNQQSESLIAFGRLNATTNLMGVLGSPSSPVDRSAAVHQILPSAARGSFVLHAAGTNGIFVGQNEKGAARAAGGPLSYGLNFKDRTGANLVDSNGSPTSEDIMNGFDDILVSGS